jgi:hypothetical protein
MARPSFVMARPSFVMARPYFVMARLDRAISINAKVLSDSPVEPAMTDERIGP